MIVALARAVTMIGAITMIMTLTKKKTKTKKAHKNKTRNHHTNVSEKMVKQKTKPKSCNSS